MKTAKCVDVGAIQDWELDAYADGEALSHVAAHLAQCPACRARLENDRAFEAHLRGALYRFDCPSSDVLRDYYWGDLPTKRQEQVAAHLAQCSRCTDELTEMAELVAAEQGEPVSTWLTRARQAVDQVRLVVMQLVSQVSAGQPAARFVPAFRGESGETLLFEADEVAVSVSLERDKMGAYALSGQILLSPAGILPQDVVRLTGYTGADAPRLADTGHPADLDYPAVETGIDANGVFTFSNLRSGVYQLVLSLADRRVVIPSLVLESAP